MDIYVVKGKEYSIREAKARELKGNRIEFEDCKNSLEEMIRLGERTKEVIIVTSDYHTLKWKLLSMKYLNKSKVIGAKTDYGLIKKIILYSIHTTHGLSGLISSRFYNEMDELFEEYKRFIKNE